MTHIEDLLSNPNSSMVRRLVEGTRAARRSAKHRKETRFGVYLLGPDHNNDNEPGRQVGAMMLPVVDSGEVSVDQVCRSFIDAQRRAYAKTGPLRGPVELRFLSDPEREELSSARRWEDAVWGSRAEVEHDDDYGELNVDEDFGITEEEDELGLIHRRRGPDHGQVREDDFQRNLHLGFRQRDIVKDIERDSMNRILFDHVAEARQNDHEMLRSALNFQRRLTMRAFDYVMGGGAHRQAEPAGSPARGMKLAGDLFSFFKAMGATGPPKSGHQGNRGGARRLDNPNAARPAVPPAAFEETSWDHGGFGGGGTIRGSGAAVDRILTARSAQELADGSSVAADANVPALRDAHVDPNQVIASMDDAALIRAVRGRIGDIAGESAPLVDNFLSTKLKELEHGGGGYGYDGYDDDDLPD